MSKKFNQNLLNEELKKFKLISEYTFYTEEPKDENDDLILGAGGLAEVDDDPNDVDSAEVPDTGDDSNTAAAGEQPDATPAVPDAAPVTPDMDQTPVPDATPVTPDATPVTPDVSPEPPESDDIEVDVTSLVKGSEEAKQSADNASQNTDELLAKFNDLENRVGAMAAISSKIETLEKEIIKRNPTPVEKLEMRSLSSFPYNIKLTDYWKDVDGYDATGEEEEKVYTLTKDDIDLTSSDSTIKKSFDANPNDLEYDEEDI